MNLVKTDIDESKNTVTQYFSTKCKHCSSNIKIAVPPEFIDWKTAYGELLERYDNLKEYVVTYSEWLEKQTGYYPEDQYLIETLIGFMDRTQKMYPFINFKGKK